MKCKDCNCAKKGFFSYQPEAYVCTGVKEPFVIGDINSECTEYESKRNMKITREEAIKILEMFLHKQCDLERTKFAYSQEEIWHAVKMATESLELDNNLSKDSKWIPCSERLPSENGKYFATGIKGSVYIAEFYKGVINEKPVSLWCRSGGNYCNVIAWMELPPAYERRNEDD